MKAEFHFPNDYPEVRGGLTFGERVFGWWPHQCERPMSGAIVRLINVFCGHRVQEIRGAQHIAVATDPFVLALNHSQKIEAPLMGALLAQLRRGKMIRFIADWNLMLVPGVSFIYRAGQVIILDRKPAKPNFLNVLRPYLTEKTPASERAEQLIDEGQSIGIYPEGTTNRDPKNLLRGFYGAAQLSIKKGIPVVPAGIRFPLNDGSRPINEREPMKIEFGAPMQPPVVSEKPARRDLLSYHRAIMQEISRLSGKSWQPKSSRQK